MINNKSVLAIIPARIGSKRLPRKNLLNLAGKPLVGWTINAAKNCKYIDRVFVSTDDNEIAEKSKEFGINVPFLRSKVLSTNTTSTIAVVLDVLNELENKGEFYDYIVLLQPTSPLRTNIHITAAFDQLIKKNQNSIVSVCKAEHNPLWCNTLPNDGSMKSFLRKDLHNKRSQDLPNYYRLNGAIYICDVKRLKTEKTFIFSSKCSAFIMPQENSIDIDSKVDLDYAQIIMNSFIIEESN